MISLPYLSIHQMSGVDAGSFLHAQLAADITVLADGEAGFAAYCSPRGQVIALLLVIRSGADWLLVGESRLTGAVVSRLRQYVLRAKVEFVPLENRTVLGLETLAACTAAVPAYRPANLPLHYVVGDPAPTPADDVVLWRQAELQCGVTWLAPETSERFLPQMLGFDRFGAVSFAKGCYPGQEIIARARYLGRVKRGPVLLEVETVPPITLGESCMLNSEGQAIEAVVVDLAAPAEGSSERPGATVLVVAALDDAAQVNTFECRGMAVAARRLPFTQPVQG